MIKRWALLAMKPEGVTSGPLGLFNLYWPALAFFTVGFWGYGLDAVGYFTAVPGDLGDARFNSVILEHLYQWATSNGVHLWSPSFFYPFEGVLAFSDNHFGSALPYIVLRSLGSGREVAFDVWFLTGIALNFVCSYVVIRRLGLSAFAAAAGAFAFSFALPVLAKEGHAQLTYRFAIPLAYGAFLELCSRRRAYPLWRVAVWTAVQFFCSIYLGIFLLYLLGASLCGFAFLNRKTPLFSDLRNSFCSETFARRTFFLAMVTISIVATGWLLSNYYSVAATYDFKRSWGEVASMLPRLSSYLIADRSPLTSWVGNFVTGIPMRHEHQIFFGLGVWILGVCGALAVWRNKSYPEFGKLAFIALASLFLLTLQFGGISFYRPVFFIPGFSAVRAVTRIVLVMLMPIAILVAIGSQHLLDHVGILGNGKKSLLQFIVLILLGAEVVAYQPYNTPIAAWTAQQTVLREKLPPKLAADTILYVSGTSMAPQHMPELDGMILAQDVGYPTLNGYSGNIPPRYMESQPCISYRNRINSYVDFTNRSVAYADALAARVTVIALEACDHEPRVAAKGVILTSQPKQILLSFANVSTDKNQLTTEVIVHNNSSETFSTRFNSGPPLRLSWRFVPENATEKGSGWDARKDLVATLPSGGSMSEALSVPLPTTPGNYLFQISIVHDGVAWFHDMGMKVPNTPVTVGAEK